jgi:hypothetical protein
MPMDIRSEMLYGFVSFAGSALDGSPVKGLAAQPPVLQVTTGAQVGTPAQGGGTLGSAGGVSAPQYLWSEFARRMMTHIVSPSATLVVATSGYAIALTIPNSGLIGRLQGHPFLISAAGAYSVQLTTGVSTTSNQIRKVLVTLGGFSAQPVQSQMALAGGTLAIIIGSAMATSASTVISGGDAMFDRVPIPVPSAGEVPVGWLNVPNNFLISSTVSGTMVWGDYRAVQGLNLSALLAGIPQP